MSYLIMKPDHPYRSENEILKATLLAKEEEIATLRATAQKSAARADKPVDVNKMRKRKKWLACLNVSAALLVDTHLLQIAYAHGAVAVTWVGAIVSGCVYIGTIGSILFEGLELWW